MPRKEKNAKLLIELTSLSLYLSKKIGLVKKLLKVNKPTLKCTMLENEVKGEIRVLDPYRPIIGYGDGEAIIVLLQCPRGLSSLSREVEKLVKLHLQDYSEGFF